MWQACIYFINIYQKCGICSFSKWILKLYMYWVCIMPMGQEHYLSNKSKETCTLGSVLCGALLPFLCCDPWNYKCWLSQFSTKKSITFYFRMLENIFSEGNDAKYVKFDENLQNHTRTKLVISAQLMYCQFWPLWSPILSQFHNSIQPNSWLFC